MGMVDNRTGNGGDVVRRESRISSRSRSYEGGPRPDLLGCTVRPRPELRGSDASRPSLRVAEE